MEKKNTPEPEGIKQQLTQKAFEAAPTLAGLLRRSGFPV